MPGCGPAPLTRRRIAMELIYNSETYTVMRLGVTLADAAAGAAGATGFEIVDKAARREMFLQGELAERFREGVEDLVRQGAPTMEAFDEYIAGFGGLAQLPLAAH
jgi:hypothetical protein